MNDHVRDTPVGAPTAPHSDPASGTADGLGSEVRLPRPPGVFRRWLAAHPQAVDWTIVGTYLFGCALFAGLWLLVRVFASDLSGIDPEGSAEIDGLAASFTWPWVTVNLIIVALVAVALRLRRRYPLAGLLVVAGSFFFEQGLLVVPNSIALIVLLYAVPVYRSVAAGWVGFGVVVAVNSGLLIFTGSAATGFIGPSAAQADAPFDMRESIAISIINALWLLAVLMIAINLGNRRRYVEALIDRAHQLAREREQQAQLAAAAERSRIAREMHDIVAHSLSVVVTLSEAASVAVDSQPKAAKHAMERAAETGRSALVEMRRLLGVLSDGGEDREGPIVRDRSAAADPTDTAATGHTVAPATTSGVLAPRSPQPGMAELYGLIDGFRQAGLRVTVTETGVAAGDASQQLAVFRIVQEGLTNALRYAGRGADTTVSLRHSPEETSIEVRDSGAVAGVQASAEGAGATGAHVTLPNPGRGIPGSGRGLAGAAERAKMFGGTLEAAAHGNGWRLVANVPVTAPAAGTVHPPRVVDDESEKR